MPTSREIGREAGRVFGSACPPGWVLRSQEDQEDFGVDFEVEPTVADRASGVLFKAQVKGVEKPDVRVDGLHLAGLLTARFTYLAGLPLPVALVHVDTTSKAVRWTVLHVDEAFQVALQKAQAAGHATFTAVLPHANRLPEGHEQLLKTVTDAYTHILLQQMKRLPAGALLRGVAGHANLDAAAETLRFHAEDAQSRAIEEKIGAQRFQEAIDAARAVLASPALSALARFSAGDQAIRADSLYCRSAPAKYRDAETGRALKVAVEMLAAMRLAGSPKHLRKAARVLVRTLRLRLLVEREWGLFLSSRVHAAHGTDLSRALARALRNATVIRLNPALHRLQTCVQFMVSGSARAAAPFLLPQILRTLTPLLVELRDGASRAPADQLTGWLEALCEIAVDAAVQQRNWNGVALSALQLFCLADPHDAASVELRAREARQAAARVEDARIREDLLAELASAQERWTAPMPTGPSLDDERDMIRAILRGYGVDVHAGEDEAAEIGRLALRDLDPGRVLRSCVHLYVVGGRMPPIASQLNLQSGGEKILKCTKHKYALASMSLDTVGRAFAERYCAGCSDRSPHAAAWSWSREWQLEQDRQFGPPQVQP